MSNNIPEWSNRQVVLATLFVVAVAGGFWLIYRFRLVVFILFVAIVLGTAIRPAVNWLNKRGTPRSAGVIVMYLFILSAIAGFVILIFPLIAGQVTQIALNVPDYYQDMRSAMIGSSSRLLRILGYQLPAQLFSFFQGQVQSDGETIDRVSRTLQVTALAARGLFISIAVFLLGFYWTLDSERIIRTLLFILPSDRRDNFRELIAEVDSKLGSFIQGQSILMLAIGGMSLVSYLLIGLPYALVLAIFAGLMEAVPVVGPILGAVPAAFVALTIDPTKVVLVVVATAVIQGLENYLLVPRVMGKSVGVSPFVIILSLAAFTSLLGLPGALLAIPIAAIIEIIIERLVFSLEPPEDQIPAGRDYASVLRLEAQDLTKDVRMQLRHKDAPSDDRTDKIEDEIEAITLQLDALLEQVNMGQNQL
jgi:predicted PurR-regulated permease PerM